MHHTLRGRPPRLQPVHGDESADHRRHVRVLRVPNRLPPALLQLPEPVFCHVRLFQWLNNHLHGTAIRAIRGVLAGRSRRSQHPNPLRTTHASSQTPDAAVEPAEAAFAGFPRKFSHFVEHRHFSKPGCLRRGERHHHGHCARWPRGHHMAANRRAPRAGVGAPAGRGRGDGERRCRSGDSEHRRGVPVQPRVRRVDPPRRIARP